MNSKTSVNSADGARAKASITDPKYRLGFLETAANPYASALGDPSTAETRLNLSQSFNGLGQFFGPLIGGMFFFEGKEAAANGGGAGAVTLTYVGIAIVVMALIAMFAKTKLPDLREAEAALDAQNAGKQHKSLASHKEFVWGVVTLFFYVAAQVGVGAFFINLATETWQGLTTKKPRICCRLRCWHSCLAASSAQAS